MDSGRIIRAASGIVVNSVKELLRRATLHWLRMTAMSLCRVLLMLAPLAVAAQAPTPQVPTPQASGLWEGAINLPSGVLEVAVSLDRSSSGSWAGTIDIPAQGAKAMPLANITVDGPAIRFSIAGVPGGPTLPGSCRRMVRHPGRLHAGPGQADVLVEAQHDWQAHHRRRSASAGTEAAIPVRDRRSDDSEYCGWCAVGGDADDSERRGRVSGRDPHHGIGTTGSERIHRRTQAVPRPGGLLDAPGYRCAAA